MRVPAMNRAEVRAQSNKHAEGEEGEIMQAIHDLMHGKIPQAGRGTSALINSPGNVPVMRLSARQTNPDEPHTCPNPWCR